MCKSTVFFPVAVATASLLFVALPLQQASAASREASARPATKSLKKPPQRARKVQKVRRAQLARPYAAPVAAPAPQPLAQSPFSPYGWLITVNAKALVSPRYVGSAGYGFIAFPTVSFRRPDAPVEWSSPDDSISFAAFTSSGFNIGPVIAYRGGRYDKGNGELRGVHNVGWTLEPGVFASQWVVPDALRVRAEIRRGFRHEDGFVASLGADWVTRWQNFTFGFGPRLNLAEARYMRSRFGVTATDNANNPKYAAYNPGGGIASAGAYGSLTWQYSKDWAFTAHGGWDRLVGGAAKSPIVRQTGNRNQFTAGVTASYTFQLTP